MSYDIVKGLKLKEDVKEVWIKAASSNVEPKSYYWEELKGLSAQYKHHGEEEVIKIILRMYWEGNFQPGTQNNFYKAVKVFEAKNPKVHWENVGEVVTEELCTCPLEDLPKYLNSQDRQVKAIVKRRLNGETVDPATIDRPIRITRDDFYDKLYSIYINYRKRKKGKFLIKYHENFITKIIRYKSFYHSPRKEDAKVFPSWEDAAIACKQNNSKLNNIIEEI